MTKKTSTTNIEKSSNFHSQELEKLSKDMRKIKRIKKKLKKTMKKLKKGKASMKNSTKTHDPTKPLPMVPSKPVLLQPKTDTSSLISKAPPLHPRMSPKEIPKALHPRMSPEEIPKALENYMKGDMQFMVRSEGLNSNFKYV